MKVKIDTRGFRFRLDEDEVNRLSHDENIELDVHLGQDSMEFVLGTIVDERPICALDAGRLSVHLPAVWLVKWAENDISGFEFRLDQEDLTVVVEKDFPCRHGSSGEPGYPPPRKMSSLD